MALLYIIIFTLWFLSALADYSQFCHIWQLKEYRFDRLSDYASSISGKKFFYGWRILQKPLIYSAVYFILPVNFNSLAEALAAVLSIDLLYNLWVAFSKKISRPKLTAKAAALIVLSLSVEGSLFYLYFNNHLIFIVLAIRWLIFSALASAAKLPTAAAKLIYLKIAADKLAKYKKLIVIGVAGSYGKTTVKNFLAQILRAKYKIIITPENINTEIGIAKFIIKNNFSDYNIFAVEMGAYKIGEIAVICKMIKPKIGILTAVSDQHLSLFGNIKNTQSAKYELLRSLPADGLAITNSDNKYCREFIAELKSQVETFGSLNEFKPACLIKNPAAADNGINFTASTKNNGELKIFAPIPGIHNGLNIASVILTAEFLNLTSDEIIKACAKLKLPPKVLESYSYWQSLIIDDSYNANPEGFLAALEVLAGYQNNKKIVITRGMLELGESSRNWHKIVGEKIERTADELIIISDDYAPELKSAAGKIKITVEANADKLLEIIKNFKGQNSVILLENRLQEKIYREIKNKK